MARPDRERQKPRLCWWALLAAACAPPPPPAAAPPPERPELRLAGSLEPRLTPPGPTAGSGTRSVAAAPDAAAGSELVPLAETRAVVLLYHSFDVGPQPLGLSSRRFASHLEWLAQSDVHVIPLGFLIDFLEGKRRLPAKVAVITIDDGHRSVYDKAWPLLRQHGFPFALGLPTAFMGGKKRTLRWEQIREMVGSGLCEVASHGHRHRRLGPLDAKRTHQELELSREIIAREAGVRPIAYFYPLGAHESPAPDKAANAGYRAAFTATGGAIAHGAFTPHVIPRTTVFHSDGAARVSWLFSRAFLDRLPLAARRGALTASSDIR